jgi:nanoRNase/pAp phosphatase (c-di-AMP/oligoRNAs hydrolase)
MNQELTPKQQASELIKQAHNIVIVTGREPNNDQLSAAIATQRVLNKLHKQASVVITDKLPKSAELFDTQFISTDIQGVRDFVIKVDMHDVVVDKLKYNVEGDYLDVTVTPLNGNFSAKDVSFEHGPFKFDLVIALGVPQILKMDKIVEQNPTIFDGLHLINIDYHRINEGFGSVNYIDQNASSVCEMLVSLFESLEQGMVDESIATALYTGITSATHNFTIPDTTAKSMTVAAQMLAAGAKQQEVVRVMNARNNRIETKPTGPTHEVPKAPDSSAPTSIKEALEKAQKEVKEEVQDTKIVEPAQSSSDGSKKKQSGAQDNFKPNTSSPDPIKAN